MPIIIQLATNLKNRAKEEEIENIMSLEVINAFKETAKEYLNNIVKVSLEANVDDYQKYIAAIATAEELHIEYRKRVIINEWKQENRNHLSKEFLLKIVKGVDAHLETIDPETHLKIADVDLHNQTEQQGKTIEDQQFETKFGFRFSTFESCIRENLKE
jgi:hypothetical protein